MTSWALVSSGYAVGSRMEGIGVRIWELAHALSRHGRVTVLTPRPSDLVPSEFEIAGNKSTWPDIIKHHDVVVFFDSPSVSTMWIAWKARKVIVSENAVPIEQMEYAEVVSAPDPAAVHESLVRAYELQLLMSDHFIVRSSVERATLLASLIHLGRVAPDEVARSRTLDHILTDVPIGYSAWSDRHSAAVCPSAPVDLVWNGGLWSFFDPVLLIEAVGLLAQTCDAPTLRFMYAGHGEEAGAVTTAIERAATRAGVRDLVTLGPSVGHLERDGVLRSGRAIVCIGRPGVENDTCVRLRLRDSFLYRLPTIVDRNGATGALVESLGIGRAVANTPGDIATAIVDVLRNNDRYRGKIDAVRARFCVDSTIESLGRAVDGIRARSIDPSARRRVEAFVWRHRVLERDIAYPFIEGER